MNRKRKTIVSVICILLAVLMALSLIMMVIPARANAISESDIQQLRDRRELLNAQLQEQADLIRERVLLIVLYFCRSLVAYVVTFMEKQSLNIRVFTSS